MPEPKPRHTLSPGRPRLPAPPSWTKDAVCAQVGGDLWFCELSDVAASAVRLCEGCPVKRDCVAYAVAGDEQNGIWGGVSFANPRARTRARVSLGLPASP